MDEILTRVDVIEFVGLDFDESGCHAFEVLPPTLKELKLHSCTFADGGHGLFCGLQSDNYLENFEMELSPINPEAIAPVTPDAPRPLLGFLPRRV